VPQKLKLVVFAGPTRPELTRGENIGVRPPARGGDLLPFTNRRDHVLILADGMFWHSPAVTHYELLTVLGSGVLIIGTASMGALRAAELRNWGMIGAGASYRAILRGIVIDDAELAVGMDPYCFQSFTIPLIGVRNALARAAEHDIPLQKLHDMLRIATEIHFMQRTSTRLLSQWRQICSRQEFLALGPLLESAVANTKIADLAESISFATSHIELPLQSTQSLRVSCEALNPQVKLFTGDGVCIV
jgi:hypothetical protein